MEFNSKIITGIYVILIYTEPYFLGHYSCYCMTSIYLSYCNSSLKRQYLIKCTPNVRIGPEGGGIGFSYFWQQGDSDCVKNNLCTNTNDLKLDTYTVRKPVANLLRTSGGQNNIHIVKLKTRLMQLNTETISGVHWCWSKRLKLSILLGTWVDECWSSWYSLRTPFYND